MPRKSATWVTALLPPQGRHAVDFFILFKFTSVWMVMKCDHPVSVTGTVLEVSRAASEDRGSLFQLVTAFCVRRTDICH